VIAVDADARLPALPGTPTLNELGLGQYKVGNWFGLLAPAGTPKVAIEWVNREATKALSAPDSKARFSASGAVLPLGTPEAFAAHIAAETKKFGDVVKRANITIN
jgi:tripartite-type tricarboxylate transporter receptor subunit TctC